MKKISLLFIISFVFNTIIGQDIVLEQELELKSHKIRTHLIPNSETNNLLTIIVDKKDIRLQLMDDEFNVIKTGIIEKPKMNALGYINYYYEAGKYHIYFSNSLIKNKSIISTKENSIFYVVYFDVESEAVTKEKFSIPD